MVERPVYQKIFEYMLEHYEFKAPDNPLTRFYKWDIAENQYYALDGPVEDEKHEFKSPEEAAELIREFAWAVGADLVGFTEVKDSIVFTVADIPQKYAIVLAKEMDYDRIITAPDFESGTEVLRVYWRIGEIVVKLASFIRRMGYPAVAHHPRSFWGRKPTVLHPIAAYEAGLGEIGRHSILITEEFGPRVRIATVTTDLELPLSEKKTFGVEEYCENCSLCRDACEGEAIPDEMAMERGVLKYTIDPYKCLPHFAEQDGCNLCVSKCVFNKRPEELKEFIGKLKEP
jgi:ferredoxin